VAPPPASRKDKNVTDSTKDTNIQSPKPTPAKPAAEVDKQTEASDVKALLNRHTFDGKGDNAVPPASFRGFSTEGVEKGALKDPETVAQEVLSGNWGANAQIVVERLTAAGYDGETIDAIEREFNERKLRGAPSAF
jgi:Cpl-7 lysozyme-like protein